MIDLINDEIVTIIDDILEEDRRFICCVLKYVDFMLNFFNSIRSSSEEEIKHDENCYKDY